MTNLAASASPDMVCDREVEEKPLRLLRKDIQLLDDQDSAAGVPSWKIYDPLRNQFFRIGWLQFECLRHWRLGKASSIIAAVQKSTPLRVSDFDIQQLSEFLERKELLEINRSEQIAVLDEHLRCADKAWWMRTFMFTMYHRFPLLKPDPILARVYTCVKPLIRWQFGVLIALLTLFAIVGVSGHWFEFKDQFQNYLTPKGMLGFGLVLLFINVIHEFGHGVAAHHFKCRVPRMGVALIFMLPLFYSDTSDSWRLNSSRQRMWIGAAGILTEMLIALVATYMWLILPDGLARTLAYFVAVTSWAMSLLVNVNPFMKFDGYYLLSDALGVENLQERSFANFRWQLRRSLLGVDEPVPYQAPPRKHRIICAYAMGTWVYRLFLYMGIAWMVYNFWFKALGLVMMSGVFAMMLIKPVVEELSNYVRIVKETPWNPRRWGSFAVVAVLLLLCLVPLPRKITAPAVYSAADSARIFSPQSAVVESISVKEGDQVTQGQVLLTLSDPELVFKQQSLQREIRMLEYRLQQERSWRNSSGYRQVSREELDSKKAEHLAVSEQLAQLVLRSPFDAQLAKLHDWVKPGTWLEANEVIAEVANPALIEVRAYIEAVNHDRVVDRPAWFYRNDGEALALLKLKSVSSMTVQSLEDKVLAVLHGGSIPAVASDSGELQPREDWHKSVFVAESAEEQQLQARQEQVGFVLIPAAASSLLVQGLRRLYAVFLRESGF